MASAFFVLSFKIADASICASFFKRLQTLFVKFCLNRNGERNCKQWQYYRSEGAA